MLCEIRVGVPGDVQAEGESRECKVFQGLNLQTEGIKLWVTGSASVYHLEQPRPNSG